ncbi:Protein CBR-GNA-2 [Caenorhabditis briggsae]|uniref:glucosamine-phosphate N-acetyltransferase n=2 Tax=Caenorhabditis briggsae TaxID=6238 RepID=A0AAE9A3T2_CAEBR|nr:Protein CBR-GNA-2 [Caenorhabditis briggsae]ULT90820.1 hypothetical protein L3Y34_008851 [Caenorhabditis briggsae]CAP36567.1 Protein CBR-GNA-2 [Caenorhabditis briggsae]
MASLFDDLLLPTNVPIPDGFNLRALRNDDFGYLELLKQLTSVGFINQLVFRKRFDAMKKAKSYYIVVLEEVQSSKIVGAATLLIEFKFIHEAGTRGRIEDVVVDERMRGKKLGGLLNQVLVEMAKTIGVYKLSLECKTELIPFYQKFGYQKNLHFLDQRFEEDSETPVKQWPKPRGDALFNEDLIPSSVKTPSEIRVRSLRPNHQDDYLKLLEQLTSVGFVSKHDFEQRFLSMKNADTYFIVVLEDVTTSKIVGAASLVVEFKYIHECGLRGRIEDVVVDEAMRGKKLGVLLNKILVEMARELGVYKLSLECKTELCPFYTKFGYKENINFMVQRFEEPTQSINTFFEI